MLSIRRAQSGWAGMPGVVVVLCLCSASAPGQAPIRAVVLSGQPAPGFVTNRAISSVMAPVIGHAGEIWFQATLSVTAPGVGPSTVLYRATPGGAPQPVFTNGNVPGFSNRTWSSWSNLVAGGTGEIAFTAGMLVDGTLSSSGVFRYDNGTLEFVTTTEFPAPGRPVPFTAFESLVCSPGLRLVIKGRTGATGNDTGVWAGLGPLQLTAFEGEPATSVPAGVLWGDTGGTGTPAISPGAAPVVNMLGDIASKLTLTGTGVTASNNEGIWWGSPLFLVKVAREGDPVVAAGAPAGATWLQVGPPSLNDRGEMAFIGIMTGTGITSADDEAMFVGTGGNLTMVLREDGPAPGLQGLRLHGNLNFGIYTFRSISINNQGKVAFLSTAFGSGANTNNDALAYVGDATNGWTLLGREGDAAPTGTPPTGETYGDFASIGISAANDIAIESPVNNVNRGLFAGPLGMHGLIARRSGPIEIAPGDVRTIGTLPANLQFAIASGGSDGKPRSLSNAGNITFRAAYNGGEGIFEATLRPVMQPPGDRDGDGIRDDWESGPIDLNEDGVADLDLVALGADPDHKDVFVEIDVHNLVNLSVTPLDLVVLAFDDAPISNPDGVDGITLHLMYSDHFAGPGIWLVSNAESFPLDYAGIKNQFFGDPEDRASPNAIWRLEARRRTMRYMMVITETLPGYYAGTAELNGNDCALVFGTFDMVSDIERAATLMHELGHMLGLQHGGLDEVNLKPNYPSIMNYTLSRRMPFSDGFWRLDYSREGLPPLDEFMLNETVGAGFPGPAGPYANFQMPFGTSPPVGGPREVAYVRLDGSPTDFGAPFSPVRDGIFSTNATQDLNFLGASVPIPGAEIFSMGEVLRSQNDWAHVSLRIGVTGAFANNQVVPQSHPEPGSAMWAWMAANLPRPPGSCAADFNKSGGSPSVQDIFDFLAAYFMNSPWADFNRSGGAPTVQDIFDYLAAYFMPC